MRQKKNNDLVFICRKCEHQLFISDGVNLNGLSIVRKLANDCPNCGEEAQDLWIFSGTGNYEQEYGDQKESE